MAKKDEEKKLPPVEGEGEASQEQKPAEPKKEEKSEYKVLKKKLKNGKLLEIKVHKKDVEAFKKFKNISE